MRPRYTLLILLLFGARSAGAQAIRGVTISQDSLFVPGVIITLIDDKGRAVARALGDEEGKFNLRAPAAGMYHLEARRVGFRPTIDVPLQLEEGKIRLHTLMLTGAPVVLEGVRAVAAAQCDATPDSTTAAFAVWEEARKALLASQLTRLTRAYKVDVTTFVKKQGIELNPHFDSTMQQGLPIRPFASQPPDQLARDGYLSRNRRSAVFHAPDEEVLLSDSFAATHCLRILPDSVGVDGLRLGFAPVPSRRLPDISGVLTIDRATSELRRIDFNYVNLPALDAVGSPGGQISFRRLPEGSWLIEDWAIWIPINEVRNDPAVMERPTTPRRGEMPRPPQQGTTTKLGLQTTGGHVMRVAFGEETVWRREQPTHEGARP
jgi:hypothetical protein